MSKLQAVRGTQDLLPDDARRHRAITETARQLAARYGFDEIATPIFEFTEVFSRPIGEATDVVAKEMYTFTDRSGDEISLRPENTAGVARAVLSNGLTQSTPLKFFYSGPMFRHERPQKGRFRQFHQIGVELLGPSQPQADIEVIALGRDVLRDIGVLNSCRLELNTLGDAESRLAYREALVAYFSGHQAKLSPDSQDRLLRNPLRILDSKDEGDRAIILDAPRFEQYLNDSSRAFFGAILEGLERIGVAYSLNPRLVRGLDYYCHTAFEFVTDALGSQGTVLGGGRYDGLMTTLGGPSIPAVGWAAGIERLALLVSEPPRPHRPIAVIPVGESAQLPALEVAQHLRGCGWTVDMGYSGNLKKRLERANKLSARLALILGDAELQDNVIAVRDLDEGTQRLVPRGDLADRLAAYR